jgi:transposase-like protein
MERSRRQFSPELKQRIVEELEAGHLSVREAARTVQTSAAMVHHWLEEFGRYRPKRNVVEVVMKSEQDRIAALEKALAEAHLTLQVYDELITQANRLYKTDLKKSFGTAPRGPVATSGRSLSEPSARASDAPATRTTSARPASGAGSPGRRKR